MTEIPVVHIVEKLRSERIGDVVNHYAPHPFQSNKGIYFVTKVAEGQTFGFRTLVVASPVDVVFIIARVEMGGIVIVRNPFEVISRIEDLIAELVPDRKGTGAVRVETVIGGIVFNPSVGSSGLESGEVFVGSKKGVARIRIQTTVVFKNSVAETQDKIFASCLFLVSRRSLVLSGVPFVGRYDVGGTVVIVSRDGIGLVHAQSRPIERFVDIILVVCVKRVSVLVEGNQAE